jgi:hypothetical protein
MAALARDPSRRPTADAFAQMLAAVDAPRVEPAPRPAAAAIAPKGETKATTKNETSRALIYAALAAAAIATIVVAVAIMEFMAGAQQIEQAFTGRESEARPSQPASPGAPPAPSAPEPPSGPVPAGASAPAGCTHFESNKSSATWTGCPDDAVRAIVCEPFMEKLSCDCLEDGVKRWFFNTSTMPDFSTAAKAARVARQCKMGFGH